MKERKKKKKKILKIVTSPVTNDNVNAVDDDDEEEGHPHSYTIICCTKLTILVRLEFRCKVDQGNLSTVVIVKRRSSFLP